MFSGKALPSRLQTYFCSPGYTPGQAPQFVSFGHRPRTTLFFVHNNRSLYGACPWMAKFHTQKMLNIKYSVMPLSTYFRQGFHPRVTPPLCVLLIPFYLFLALSFSSWHHLLLFWSFTLRLGDSHCHLSPDGQRSIPVLGHTEQSPPPSRALLLCRTPTHTHTPMHARIQLQSFRISLALSAMTMKKILFISLKTTQLSGY